MNSETAKPVPAALRDQPAGAEVLRVFSEVYSSIMIAYDAGQHTLYYAPAQLASLLGYNPVDFQQGYSSFLEVIHPEDRAFLEHSLGNLKALQKPADLQVRLLHKNGTTPSFRLNVKATQDASGAILLLSDHQIHDSSLNEIDELRQAKAEMISELQRSNKELEEFAYVASHDLQEPLRKISTFSGRLLEKFEESIDEEGKLYLGRILASAENMRLLIDNLLEFSRISRVGQQFTNVNLNFVMMQIRNEFDLIIDETQARFQIEKLPDVEGSASLLKQLFSNIVNNAIKFRKAGVPPEIVIKAMPVSAAEKQQMRLQNGLAYQKILVCDNGIGFESEYATRIFQIFQRLHGKSEYPGSGIGLAICRKITDHHHGLIFAENIEGQGACFTIILPERQSAPTPQ